jgi:ribosomal protein S4E
LSAYRQPKAIIILWMTEHPKFDFGDTVRITGEEHRGRVGAVVGIKASGSPRTYTIEFGDGSDSEIAEELLLLESSK